MKPQKISVLSEFKLGSASKEDIEIISLLSNLRAYLLSSKMTYYTGTLEYTYIPTCRSIRIGSYKTTLVKEKIYFTPEAIYIRVPYLTNPEYMITLVIPAEDIISKKYAFKK